MHLFALGLEGLDGPLGLAGAGLRFVLVELGLAAEVGVRVVVVGGVLSLVYFVVDLDEGDSDRRGSIRIALIERGGAATTSLN